MNSREAVRQQRGIGRDKMQLGARGVGAEDVVGRQIEVKRRMARHAVGPVEPEMRECPMDERIHVGVGDHHAFRHAGGARSEQDMRRVPLAGRAHDRARRSARDIGAAKGCRPRRGRLRIERAEQRRRCEIAERLGDEVLHRPGGEQHARLAGLEDAAQSRRRARGVERHVQGAGLEDSEHPGERRGRLGAKEDKRGSRRGSPPRAARAPGDSMPPRARRRSCARCLNERRRLRTPLGLARHKVLKQAPDGTTGARQSGLRCRVQSVHGAAPLLFPLSALEQGGITSRLR